MDYDSICFYSETAISRWSSLTCRRGGDVAGQGLGKGWSRQEIFFFPPDLGLVDLGEDDVTSTGGPGPASPLVFSAYRRTCIIASGIFTLVAGFGSQATKKMAAFFARQSTCYFENTTDVVFPRGKSYLSTGELSHPSQKPG